MLRKELDLRLIRRGVALYRPVRLSPAKERDRLLEFGNRPLAAEEDEFVDDKVVVVELRELLCVHRAEDVQASLCKETRVVANSTVHAFQFALDLEVTVVVEEIQKRSSVHARKIEEIGGTPGQARDDFRGARSSDVSISERDCIH